MSTVPTPITILHKVRVWSDEPDAHGNPVSTLADPVERKVQSVNEFGRRGSSHEIVSTDYLERVETMLEIGVPDPSLYGPDDVVIISGVAFHVEGEPSDNRLGPLPLLNRILGGAVRVRRVT